MTLRLIDVAADGSRPSMHALRVGSEIARELHAKLRVVTVYPRDPHERLDWPENPWLPPGTASDPWGEELLHEARANGPEEIERVVLRGNATDGLLAHVRQSPPELLVVGARGRSASMSLLLGSVSSLMLLKAGVPVLVTRAGERTSELERSRFAPLDILVAVNSSPEALGAFDLATDLARGLRSRLTIVSVSPTPGTSAGRPPRAPRGPRRPTEELLGLEALLEHRAHLARERGVGDVSVRLLQGDTTPALLAYVREHPVDLIVLGSRGLATPRPFFSGGVSLPMARFAPCPVLVVPRPPGLAAKVPPSEPIPMPGFGERPAVASGVSP